MDIDGSFQDPREHTLSISVEVETNIPIYNNRTIVSADNIIDIMQYNIDAVSTNKLIK
jgi:hypothetical protein